MKKEDFAPLLLEALNSWDNEEQVVKSGFEFSGTYPLNPEIVKFDKLKKKKQKKSSKDFSAAIETSVPTDSGSGSQFSNEKLLNFFEEYIPADILEKFKQCNVWPDNDAYFGFFNVWLKMKSDSSCKNLGMNSKF